MGEGPASAPKGYFREGATTTSLLGSSERSQALLGQGGGRNSIGGWNRVTMQRALGSTMESLGGERRMSTQSGGALLRSENVSLCMALIVLSPVSLWLLLSAAGKERASGSFQHWLLKHALDTVKCFTKY